MVTCRLTFISCFFNVHIITCHFFGDRKRGERAEKANENNGNSDKLFRNIYRCLFYVYKLFILFTKLRLEKNAQITPMRKQSCNHPLSA